MAISIYKWHRSSRYQKGCGTCLNADFASWGRRCLAETSKSLWGWDGQPDVTEPFSVFKFGFKLLWIVLTSQLWNKCPKRYTLNCLPWNIARKSPIDRQKITTLEYEMKEYGEVLSSDVKWCQVMSWWKWSESGAMWWVKCAEVSLLRSQESRKARTSIKERSSQKFLPHWHILKPRETKRWYQRLQSDCQIFSATAFFRVAVFLRGLFEAYMVEFKFKAPVRIFAERGLMRRNDEETLQ